MTSTPSRRDYDRSRRQATSDATRQRILDAARSIVIRHGYRGTKVADIASASDVHVATVYALVGRKPVMLRELIERAISGADRAVPADERDYVIAMRATAEPRRKLAIYAKAMGAIHVRLAPLLLALRDAATTEPEAAAVWRDISERRATNMRRLVEDLQHAGGLRHDLPIEDAADFVWATNSPELYTLMCVERSWTPDHYEAWLVDLWSRYLLPGGHR
ncbi:MAG: TetR/AcrR family transcriptional regulator [Ilumatobacteraceae bacterium]